MINNSMIRPIRYKKVKCVSCDGKGTLPLNIDDLDDEREDECPMCGGIGEYELEV